MNTFEEFISEMHGRGKINMKQSIEISQKYAIANNFKFLITDCVMREMGKYADEKWLAEFKPQLHNTIALTVYYQLYFIWEMEKRAKEIDKMLGGTDSINKPVKQ